MMSLFVLKERLKVFYGKYGVYITPLWKFALLLVSLLYMNDMTGQARIISNPAACTAIAVVCAFLPVNAIVFVSAFVLLVQLYAISFEVALVTLAVMLVMFMLYYGMKPESSLVVLLTVLAFFFRIPYVLPLAMGLVGGLSSVLPIAFGTVIYYILLYTKQNAAALGVGGTAMDLQRYTQFIDGVAGNKMMQLLILTFAVTLIVVYAVRRLTVDHAWSIGIAVGAIAEITMLLIGDFVFEVSISIIPLLISLVFSVLIAFILEFFLFAVDYSRTEYTQFDDDEYYYYVKAVPKIAVTTPDLTVRKFNAREVRNNELKRKDRGSTY